MRRIQASTQAMFEFQRLIRELSYDLQLMRTGTFWELWFVGEDFGKSEAEIAELAESTESYYYSNKYGPVQITPQGAIRSLDFGHGYEDRPVLAQLITFIGKAHGDSYIIDIFVDVRPNGSMIDVDVVGVEDNSGYVGDEFVEGTLKRTIAQFTYDPTQNLLLHRTAK